jgi:hypothetical protein
MASGLRDEGSEAIVSLLTAQGRHRLFVTVPYGDFDWTEPSDEVFALV